MMNNYSDMDLWFMYGDLIPECFQEKEENQNQ